MVRQYEQEVHAIQSSRNQSMSRLQRAITTRIPKEMQNSRTIEFKKKVEEKRWDLDDVIGTKWKEFEALQHECNQAIRRCMGHNRDGEETMSALSNAFIKLKHLQCSVS